jgi:hypothetical protein
MSLDYDFRDCADVEFIREHPGTLQTVCFQMMFVGLGEITEKNFRDVAFRFYVYDRVFGPLCDGGVQLDVLKNFVGLRLNVPDTTKAVFFRTIRDRLEEEATRYCNREGL